MTIERTIDIPTDRRLRLDLAIPDDLPLGTADIKVTIRPRNHGSFINSLGALYGCLKDDPNFAGSPEEIQQKIREDVWKDSI